MDYIESLRVFRAVVEARSLTRAADMLGVAPPVVSRAITALQQRLGSRLFHRTTRQVSLTEVAGHFYEGCSRILVDLEALEAGASMQTSEPSGVLRLVAHTTVTVNRLVPLISVFKHKHPKVSLDATLTERPIDLVADGYDLGIVVPFMLSSDTTVTSPAQRANRRHSRSARRARLRRDPLSVERQEPPQGHRPQAVPRPRAFRFGNRQFFPLTGPAR